MFTHSDILCRFVAAAQYFLITLFYFHKETIFFLFSCFSHLVQSAAWWKSQQYENHSLSVVFNGRLNGFDIKREKTKKKPLAITLNIMIKRCWQEKLWKCKTASFALNKKKYNRLRSLISGGESNMIKTSHD